MTEATDTLPLREIHAQAAVWVTDLHGPERSPEVEAGVRQWLSEDPRHAQAFELATEAWENSSHFPLSLLARGPSIKRRITRKRVSAACVAALGVALAVTFYALENPTLATGPAEQRTVDLADGTQVTLNASSRITIDFTEAERRITLSRGEALFTVAHDAARPFSVIVGDRKVVALGTRFDVRREDAKRNDFAVTLIEGRVTIAPLSSSITFAIPKQGNADVHPNLMHLQPGQRLRFAAHASDTLDSPPIDNITAWQRGQLIFDDVSIRDAAIEFNRYGKRKLTIDPSIPITIRVGGVFQIGDPSSFARATANAHHLYITETAEEIKLAAR